MKQEIDNHDACNHLSSALTYMLFIEKDKMVKEILHNRNQCNMDKIYQRILLIHKYHNQIDNLYKFYDNIGEKQ